MTKVGVAGQLRTLISKYIVIAPGLPKDIREPLGDDLRNRSYPLVVLVNTSARLMD